MIEQSSNPFTRITPLVPSTVQETKVLRTRRLASKPQAINIRS
jgi:hypothetical protein